MNVALSIAVCLAFFLTTTLRGDEPHFRYLERIAVHIAKGGHGWIEATRNVPDDWPADNDFLADYGLKNLTTQRPKTANKVPRVVTRGEFTNILQIVQVIDSSIPFQLSRRRAFEIRWNGTLLVLHLSLTSEDSGRPRNSLEPDFVITTDGMFTDNSTGRISQNRTRLTVEPTRNLTIEISGLTAE